MQARTILPLIFFAAVIAKADVVTTIAFLSPGTIQAGGTVTIDLGVTFNPLPGNVGSTEFVDNNTATQVSSCAADLNPCTELQILTTASTLTSVFTEAFGAKTPTGIPDFYPETGVGNFQLVLSYPDPGIWEITTTGAEQEQFSELDCSTPWLDGAPAGAASCSTIRTISFAGGFDPAGAPQVFVTVEPAGVAAPEPAGLGLLSVALILIGSRCRRWLTFPSSRTTRTGLYPARLVIKSKLVHIARERHSSREASRVLPIYR